MGAPIPGTGAAAPGAQGGQGASLPGAGHPPAPTRGHGHAAYRLHAHSLGLHHPGPTHRVSTVMDPGALGHPRTLPLAVRMEDEPRGHLEPVGKKVSHQVKDTAAALESHFTVSMQKAEGSLHVTEDTVRADRL